MKKLIHAVSAACLAFATASPAFADMPEFVGPPEEAVYDDPYPDLSAICAAEQKPNVASGFRSVAINVLENQTVTSDPYDDPDLTHRTTTGNGTPTRIRTFDTAHVNGQSVNIHAYLAEIDRYATSTTSIPRFYDVTTATTFDCHIHKAVPGKGTGDDLLPGHEGFNLSPFGLKTGLSVLTGGTQTFSTTPRTIAGPSPFDVTVRAREEVVICISPTKNPGTWRNANNYAGELGACSRTWHDSLGLSQPTASIPAS
jgi:hypothetical protein